MRYFMRKLTIVTIFTVLDKTENKRREDEKRFWDKGAVKYDRWIENSFDEQYRVFRKRIKSYIRSDDEILEIGCGTGDISFQVAPLCKKVTGTDISPEMIAIARSKLADGDYPNLSFSVEDAYKLPFPDAAFHKVICVNALQTMKEPERVVREARRVLKNNGEFIAVMYCYGDSKVKDIIKLFTFVVKRGRPKYWTFFKRGGVAKLFTDAGYEIVEAEDVWDEPVVCFVRGRKNQL